MAQTNGTDKSLESWIWDAACSIRGAKDAPKYKEFFVPNHGKLWKSLMRAHLGDYERIKKRLPSKNPIPLEVHHKPVVASSLRP